MISFRNFLLENESRINFIKKQNPEIEHAWDGLMWNHITNRLENQFPGKDRAELYQFSIAQRTPHIIDTLAHNFDPTDKKIYTDWLVRQYKKRNFRWEDNHRVRENLQDFEAYKPRLRQDGEPTDINAYPHIADVEAITRRYKNLGIATSNAKELERIKKHGVEIVHNQNGVKVERLKTQEAACALHGHDTRWCTAARDHNYFNQYNKQGPLYVIHDTKSGRKFQLHFQSDQLADESDRHVDPEGFVKQYPEVRNVKEFDQHLDPYSKDYHFHFLDDKERDKYLDHFANDDSVGNRKNELVVEYGKPHHHRDLYRKLEPALAVSTLNVVRNLAERTKDRELLRQISHHQASGIRGAAQFRLHKEFGEQTDILAGVQGQRAKKGSDEHLKALYATASAHMDRHNYYGKGYRGVGNPERATWHLEQFERASKEFDKHFPHFQKAPSQNAAWLPGSKRFEPYESTGTDEVSKFDWRKLHTYQNFNWDLLRDIHHHLKGSK